MRFEKRVKKQTQNRRKLKDADGRDHSVNGFDGKNWVYKRLCV